MLYCLFYFICSLYDLIAYYFVYVKFIYFLFISCFLFWPFSLMKLILSTLGLTIYIFVGKILFDPLILLEVDLFPLDLKVVEFDSGVLLYI